MSVDKRGVPVNTILVSALVTALCVLINYFAPESAFGLLMALVVSATVINWAMISWRISNSVALSSSRAW